MQRSLWSVVRSMYIVPVLNQYADASVDQIPPASPWCCCPVTFQKYRGLSVEPPVWIEPPSVRFLFLIDGGPVFVLRSRISSPPL